MIKLVAILLAILFFVLIINILHSKVVSHELSKNLKLYENTIYVNRVKINYIKKGTGSPLLLLHGFMNSLHFFEDIIDDLSQSNTVYAIDIIGFGLSDKNISIDYTKKNMAKVAKEFMEFQGIKKFDALGHSMGGEVVLNMAYHFPECINRLILVGSAGYVKTLKPFYFIQNIKWLFPLFVKYLFCTYTVLYLFFRLALYDKKYLSKKKLNQIFVITLKLPFKTLQKICIQNNKDEISNKVRFIKAPSLIICGKEDRFVKLKYGKRLHNDLQNSSLLIFENCGHIPFLEKRDEFIASVKHFLL
jgi:pimeloyl-ACP methyl ester carboxylesterase